MSPVRRRLDSARPARHGQSEAQRDQGEPQRGQVAEADVWREAAVGLYAARESARGHRWQTALYAAVVGATGVAESVTASLTINFLRGAPAGGIIAQARILKTGRMTAGEALLLPEGGGDPVAQVVSTWSVPRKSG